MITLEEACEIYCGIAKAHWIHVILETEDFWAFVPWMPPVEPWEDPQLRYMLGISIEAISKADGHRFWVEMPDMPPSLCCESPAKDLPSLQTQRSSELEKLKREYAEFKEKAAKNPRWAKKHAKAAEEYYGWLLEHPDCLIPARGD